MFGGQHRRDAVTLIERGTWTAECGVRAMAASAGSLAYESRLRRPERRMCVLTPPTSLEMTHYPREGRPGEYRPSHHPVYRCPDRSQRDCHLAGSRSRRAFQRCAVTVELNSPVSQTTRDQRCRYPRAPTRSWSRSGPAGWIVLTLSAIAVFRNMNALFSRTSGKLPDNLGVRLWR